MALFCGLRQQGQGRTSAALCALLFLVLVAGEVTGPAPAIAAAAVVAVGPCEARGPAITGIRTAAPPRHQRVLKAALQLPPPPLRQRSIQDGGLPPVRAPDC